MSKLDQGSQKKKRRTKPTMSPAPCMIYFKYSLDITDCPPHSTASSLLLHDLLPLTPQTFFFSFSVPMYMLLICFIYWDIFNELRDCNVAVYTASLASKNKDVMQLPGVWDLHAWLHSSEQKLSCFLAPRNVSTFTDVAKSCFPGRGWRDAEGMSIACRDWCLPAYTRSSWVISLHPG